MQSVPLELVHEVVNQCDRPTLCALSLTCRRFRPAAQAALFRSATFQKDNAHKVTKFRSIITSQPALGAIVRKFTFTITALKTAANEYKRFRRVLRALSQARCQLHTLNVAELYPSKSWQSPSCRVYATSDFELGCLSQLVQLGLYKVKVCSIITAIVHAAPTITSLTLRGIRAEVISPDLFTPLRILEDLYVEHCAPVVFERALRCCWQTIQLLELDQATSAKKIVREVSLVNSLPNLRQFGVVGDHQSRKSQLLSRRVRVIIAAAPNLQILVLPLSAWLHPSVPSLTTVKDFEIDRICTDFSSLDAHSALLPHMVHLTHFSLSFGSYTDYCLTQTTRFRALSRLKTLLKSLPPSVTNLKLSWTDYLPDCCELLDRIAKPSGVLSRCTTLKEIIFQVSTHSYPVGGNTDLEKSQSLARLDGYEFPTTAKVTAQNWHGLIYWQQMPRS